jgi:hypothetical protein
MVERIYARPGVFLEVSEQEAVYPMATAKFELFGKLVATHVGGEDQDGVNGSVRCAEHNPRCRSSWR